MTESSSPEGGVIVRATSILDLLSEKIVGQQTAIAGIASTVKTYQAGLAPLGRPARVGHRPPRRLRTADPAVHPVRLLLRPAGLPVAQPPGEHPPGLPLAPQPPCQPRPGW